MAIELTSLIRVYDNALSAEVCQYLISLYESSHDHHEKIDDAKRPAFTQFNFTDQREQSQDAAKAHEHVLSRVLEYRNQYYSFVDRRCFPEEHGFEKVRIKKYRNNGEDLFDTHVDVKNHESARRFLAYIFYLNDVDQGGETIFYPAMSVKPKTGRLVVFPPLWMFPHKGCPPISNEKYIMSTYLHYQ